MNQQIQQLLKTVQNRQAKIREEQFAMDEEIQQIEKMVKEEENKSWKNPWKNPWKIPEKTFEDYVEEIYMKEETMPEDYDIPEQWKTLHKFGLLWYMVKDKKGDLMDLSDIIYTLSFPVPDHREITTDGGEKVFNLLPEKFINSFKDSK